MTQQPSAVSVCISQSLHVAMFQLVTEWQTYSLKKEKKTSLNLPAVNQMYIHTYGYRYQIYIFKVNKSMCTCSENEWATLTKRGFIGTHSSFGSHSCNASLVFSGVEVF